MVLMLKFPVNSYVNVKTLPPILWDFYSTWGGDEKKVQVGKDQEKAQSEKDSHSKNRGGKKPN